MNPARISNGRTEAGANTGDDHELNGDGTTHLVA